MLRTYYLPHHAVICTKRRIVKWRVVFDASFHEKGAIPLNDALEVGPNLLPDIVSTLLRFRLHRKALVGDSSQAFFQLILDPQDRDVTHFFWYDAKKIPDGWTLARDDVVEYRFTRLLFGLASSFFLLSATLREIANNSTTQYPVAATVLDKSLYMDDFSLGADTDPEMNAIYEKIMGLANEIRLPMAKWVTNSQLLKDNWTSTGVIFAHET